MCSTLSRMNASSDVPMTEAIRWVERIGPQLKGMSRLIVLGGGLGHHIVKLIDVFPPSKILVIEKSLEAVRQCTARYALETTEVTFLVPKTPEEILDQPIILEVLRHSYTVVRFSPVTVNDPPFYDKIEALIAGRTQAGFGTLLKCRPEMAELFRVTPELSAVRGHSDKLISIKNVIQVMSVNSSTEACLMRALSELIA